MTIPVIDKRAIFDALKYIDEKGVPFNNQSTRYDLVTDDGKKYPPKYVIAVAAHIANGVAVSTDGFNAVEARSFLQDEGFNVVARSEVIYELTITADEVVSTDADFTMDNLSLGDSYKPLSVYMQRANGETVGRAYSKREHRISNQTMPKIACQVFENEIASLSVEGRERFPICKYNPSSELICGIYSSVEEFKRHRKTIEYLLYSYGDDGQFVLYCWNLFSTIYFVQECLKRFGDPGDKMVMTYRKKDERDKREDAVEGGVRVGDARMFGAYRNPFSSKVLESKNLIFRGAPGTGKSYLAKEIAADIVSDGKCKSIAQLSLEQREQIEFVQFHPSYDYSDFVEGLRPRVNDDGTMGFELQDGIFKKFIDRARKNYEDSQKTKETIEREMTVRESMADFFSGIELGIDTFNTVNGNIFTITGVDEGRITISIPGNATVNKITLNVDEIRRMLESDIEFTKVKDVTTFFGKTFATQQYSYDFAIYKAIKAKKMLGAKSEARNAELKKYVFVIDEINRGEISKIFGELFFAIDPGYRGRAGEVSTQYANLHSDPSEKFYIPENVFIIGTMNDIDRSVDSFDFAMRRRFRFVELKADDRIEMLANLQDESLEAEAVSRMTSLNREIASVDDLNENYQIGASYFLKLRTLSFDQLWLDYLHPLLQEYIRGMYDEDGIMARFERAYGYKKPVAGVVDEAVQN